MVLAFKVAIVTFSFVFSLIKIGDYFLGGQDAYFTNKTMVGSQRFGFVFLFSFLDSIAF